MRRILIILAVLAATVGSISATVASAAPRHPAILAIYTGICNIDTPSLCMRDPSDGGTGTVVVGSAPSLSDSEEWAVQQDTSRCGGVVTETCPFFDTGIDSLYEGKQVVVIRQEVVQKCIRLPAASGASAVIGTCDTGSEPSSAYVFNVLCGGTCNTYIAVDATNAAHTEIVLETNGNDRPLFGDVQNFINPQEFTKVNF